MSKPHNKSKRQSKLGAIISLLFLLVFAVLLFSPSITGFVNDSSDIAPAPSVVTAAPNDLPKSSEAPVTDEAPASVAEELVFPGGLAVDYDAERLSLTSLTSEQASDVSVILAQLPKLTLVDLRGSVLDSSALFSLCSAAPEARFIYEFNIFGQSVNMRTENLNLSGLSHDNVAAAAEYISCMPRLKLINLGSAESSPELTWEDIGILEAAAPWAKIDYDYSLWGKTFSTADGLMDLNHITMNDGGAAVRAVLPYVYSKYLDMDSCGVSDENMAQLRDDFPDTKVVWRVWFGVAKTYTVRTDCTRILASKPSIAGSLTNDSAAVLKYCTDMKYIDIGHNYSLTNIDFIRCMPHLTALIVALDDSLTDLSPLLDCPHMEYLEIFMLNYLTDISPLAELTELRHLAIQKNPMLTDISPIMELDLERLLVADDYKFPYSQLEEFISKHPDCEVYTGPVTNDNMGTWRETNYDIMTGVHTYVQRYRFLRDQMGYSILLYSFPQNDPKY